MNHHWIAYWHNERLNLHMIRWKTYVYCSHTSMHHYIFLYPQWHKIKIKNPERYIDSDVCKQMRCEQLNNYFSVHQYSFCFFFALFSLLLQTYIDSKIKCGLWMNLSANDAFWLVFFFVFSECTRLIPLANRMRKLVFNKQYARRRHRLAQQKWGEKMFMHIRKITVLYCTYIWPCMWNGEIG